MSEVRLLAWSEDAPGTAVEEAAALLARGEVVAHPTETVYGVAAVATHREAYARMLAIKGGTAPRPFLVLFDSRERLHEAVGELPPGGEALAEEFWPGPLTLLVPAPADLADWWSGPEGHVAVRVTPHPFCRSLIRRLAAPVLSSSANRAARPAPFDAPSIKAELAGTGLALIVDAGPLVGAPSTLLRWTDCEWEIVRRGPVSRAEVARVLGGDASLPALR
ncbi:MAG: threonylcarbamoyl-AMP synthase [Gemmatimonadetes bacterium]|nr:threonylcarbamoyl-AMP synthase [Gemmatimonadota bacterium]